MRNVKHEAIESVRCLPDECTWDDVTYQIYVRQKIEAGLKDADEGRLIDHDKVFEEFDT